MACPPKTPPQPFNFNNLSNVILGALTAVFGSLGSAIHLVLFEPLMRRRGKLERLSKLKT